MLRNELAVLKDKQNGVEASREDVNGQLKAAERRLRDKEHEMHDTLAIKDAK